MTFTVASIPTAGQIFRVKVPVNASGETADVDLIWGTDIDIDPGTISDNAVILRDAITNSPALQNFVTVADGITTSITLTAVKQGPQFNSIAITPLNADGTVATYLQDSSMGIIPSTGLPLSGGANWSW